MIRWEVEDGQTEEPVELFAWPLGVKTRVGRIVRADDGSYEWAVTLGDGDDSVLCCRTAQTMAQARFRLVAAVHDVAEEMRRDAALLVPNERAGFR